MIRNNVIFSMSMNILSVVLRVAGVIGPVVGAIMHVHKKTKAVIYIFDAYF